ncbi:Uroplakin-3a [Varanus komodoensis]|nr:Uroplakin-3a [Varanus komodoensis]
MEEGVNSLLIKFADDTKTGAVAIIEEQVLQIQKDQGRLWKWAGGNGLAFNVDKCKVLHLGHRNSCHKYRLGVTDTEEIENLRKKPQATTYFADEFKSISCRVARDLLVMDMDDSQYELITVIGYQVGTETCRQTKSPFCNQVLKPSTFYRVNYFFLDDKAAIRAHTDWSPAIHTGNVTNYESADVMFEGRAGGMIVITILVSVGGAVLVIALIVAVALSNKK